LLSGISSLYTMSEHEACGVHDETHIVVAYWIYPNLVLIHSSQTIDLIQFQPGADPGSSDLRHTSLARRPSLTEDQRNEYTGLWDILDAVFTVEDVAAVERAGEGLARSARDHLLVGRNEPGVQHMIRTLRHASQQRSETGGSPP
jgi:hypothetical protein